MTIILDGWLERIKGILRLEIDHEFESYLSVKSKSIIFTVFLSSFGDGYLVHVDWLVKR
jgi:hypothetical protein